MTGTAKAFVDVNFAHAALIVLSNADAKIKVEYTEYSVEILKENLTTLVNLELQRNEKDNSNESMYIPKRIKHYFTENDMRTPYGRVISAVPGYRDWINVIYNDDLAVYVYKLGEEYRNGEL